MNASKPVSFVINCHQHSFGCGHIVSTVLVPYLACQQHTGLPDRLPDIWVTEF